MMNKLYAGFGSRKTPEAILFKMEEIAKKLSELGYTLRSGGAIGADSAFEKGASKKEIFLSKDATKEAQDFSSRFHPLWEMLDPYVRGLHARNAMIMLGQDLIEPVEFGVCWTPNGEVLGGTGQALRIAENKGIKIYNLAIEKDLENLREFVRGLIQASKSVEKVLKKGSNLNYEKGSLTDVPIGSVVGHSCNIQGDWGAGVALHLKKTYPDAYLDQVAYCKKGNVLGSYLYYSKSEVGVVSLFTSRGFGRNKSPAKEILELTKISLIKLFEETNIDHIYLPKINSGYFGVKWELTEMVLLEVLELMPRKRITIRFIG